MFLRPISQALSIAVLLASVHPACAEEALKKLEYRHAGLTVDLGVGLWAWPIPCDADGDGDYDLMVSCPDKPSNGIYFFENASGDTRINKFPVFKEGRRISKAVHYVMPSYVAGTMRVLSPGTEYIDFAKSGLEVSKPIGIAAKFYKPLGPEPKGPKVRHNQWRYVDFDGDRLLDVVVGIEDWSYYGWDDAWNAQGEWTHGPLHGFVFWFRNQGTNDKPSYGAQQQVMAADKPIDVFGCPSPNFEDFDGDGDLDLICGEFLDGFTYFQNVGNRTNPKYAAGQRLLLPNGAPVRMDLEMIVPIAFDWDRDGDHDLIVGDEDGRVALLEHVNGTVTYEAPRYFQQEAATLKCGALATPFGCDWDGDGDIDIVSGNTAGYIEYFENLSGKGVAVPKWNAPKRLEADGKVFRVMAGPNGSIQGPAEAKWGYTTINVVDWDGDGLPDVLLNSIWGRVEWLRNIGSRSEPKFGKPQSIEVQWTGKTPKPKWTWWEPKGNELVTQWRTTPVAVDMNRDGLMDLAMLDQEGYLVYFERALDREGLVLREPKRAFCDAQGKPLRLNEKTAGGSGRRKLCLVDWDGDGTLDLLLNSSNADLYRGIGVEAGIWKFEQVGTLAKQNIEGHDVSPTVVDFDGNGIPDFLGGAEDGRFYFLANPRAN